MAGQSNPSSGGKFTGKVEPDRVGRMHARRREPSVRGQLARRLAGFKGRSRPAPSGGFGSGRMQRVIVKTHISRHRPGKARGSLTRHASYLGRDSASADGRPGVFYDAQRDEVNAGRETAPWVEDRHHFQVTEDQVTEARRQAVMAARFTSLDRMIERHAVEITVDLSHQSASVTAVRIGRPRWAGCDFWRRWGWRTRSGNQRRRDVAVDIVAVAKADGGVHSAEAHVRHLQSVQPGWTES